MADPAPASETPDLLPPGLGRFLGDYGPRLGIFVVLVGVLAGLLALRMHIRGREAGEVGTRLDAALSLPESQMDARIAALRALMNDVPNAEARPWILLALGNQLFHKAQAAPGPASAPVLEEAYGLFQTVADQNADHAAAPLALFSAACTAEEMGNATNAVRLYGDLKERYPGTYLVSGAGADSFQKRHAEGLAERITRLRQAFPEGLKPPPAEAPKPSGS